jgi:hypothetical protein
VLLSPGTVTNGTALNETAATGSAANGNLGPGAVLVNGTVNSGTGSGADDSSSTCFFELMLQTCKQLAFWCLMVCRCSTLHAGCGGVYDPSL